ncbi:alpha/beta family hydrolase [Alishewanella sp. SMS8]|uniref:alpha/beta family hydrolase n=1 Tax=Alishewanella sp. SMS8 TaxID=2994676 RepID=UPI002741D536|nr:alpha/beta family hydrolase [Alishewanella sp. SMS8]MDP5207637.1 alpha/beta hydrolase [Alishewanella sp. SMS9]MDP5459283.1 alpha/beta hydrolase [Alishewanella sp. SMS8]
MSKTAVKLLLTHGAGASCHSDFMQQLCSALFAEQIEVSLFHFGYMQTRLDGGSRRPPPKATLLQPELMAALKQFARDGQPCFIAGKSMGGRIASMLAADPEAAAMLAGCFVYGYPFHAPGKSVWRTAHFNQLTVPLVILQGERDPFGKRNEVAAKHWPGVILHWLNSGDHDFKPLKSSGQSQASLIIEAASITRRYIDAILDETQP